jgi:hypothetical protein
MLAKEAERLQGLHRQLVGRPWYRKLADLLLVGPAARSDAEDIADFALALRALQEIGTAPGDAVLARAVVALPDGRDGGDYSAYRTHVIQEGRRFTRLDCLDLLALHQVRTQAEKWAAKAAASRAAIDALHHVATHSAARTPVLDARRHHEPPRPRRNNEERRDD